MRSALASLFAAPLTIFAFACSTSDSVPESTNHSENDMTAKAAEAAMIVWTAGDEGTSRHLDRDGKVVATEPGIETVAGAGVLKLKTETATDTLSCNPFGDHDWSGDYKALGLSLVDRASSEIRQVLVPMAPKPDPQETIMFEQSPMIVASVGPYIFVRENGYQMGCGAAHGGQSVKSFIWDVERGSKIVIQTPGANVLSQTALQQLQGLGEDTEEIRFAEMIPSFDEEGTLSFKYRFEKAACYACGDGKGNSYTVSAIVDGPVPEELARYAEAPGPVKNYLAANPGSFINGWSSFGL